MRKHPLLLVLCLLAVVAALALWRTRRAPVTGQTPVAAEAAPPEPASQPEDLALIHGIGPVYRARLADAGITTFAGLAAADLEAVCSATGVPAPRAADWLRQAAGFSA